MVTNPSMFTFEYLSSLKFKELQKLCVQFHVNKRWAKKQELIQNLLDLKKNSSFDENKENKWMDGSLVFKDSKTETDKRLTFCISSKSNTESVDPRLTFEIPQNGKNLLENTFDSRQTYEIPPSKEDLGVELLEDSRATYEIPPKGNLLDEGFDRRATFEIPQTGRKLLEIIEEKVEDKNDVNAADQTNSIDDTKTTNLRRLTFNVEKKENKEVVQSKVKALTIPHTRVLRRTKKDAENSKSASSSIKLSKKSINIKKSNKQPVSKIDFCKSPAPVKKSLVTETLTKPQLGKTSSKIPTKLQSKEEKLPATVDDGNKENAKKILKRKSKTADEVLFKKQNPAKVSFMSPPVNLERTSKICVPIKKTPLKKDGNNRSTPGGWNSGKNLTSGSKLSVPAKHISATKMPDFNKIHQKQFEQMDSLHDYLKKKEDRAKRLFGTPQLPTQNKALNTSGRLFQFQSSVKSESKPARVSQIANNPATPFKTNKSKIKDVQKEAFANKLPPAKVQTDIRDKNRSHIHGVRTNKRFELLLKFRNV